MHDDIKDRVDRYMAEYNRMQDERKRALKTLRIVEQRLKRLATALSQT